MVRAAVIQMQGSNVKSDSVAKACTYIRQAVANGAKIICLQELFNTIYFCYEINMEHCKLAEPIPGPTIDAIAEVAKETMTVVIAPIYEKAMDGVLYNTAVVLGPNGEIIGKYRKMSIPFVSGLMKGMEKPYFKPGNLGFPVFATPFGVNVGILICYDRHFPEAARALALNGADLVLVPTATSGKTKYLWELELRAHAVDNVYYVGGVNRVGQDIGGSDQHFYGCSMFVDPRGEIVSQAGEQMDEIVYADLDLTGISALRDEWGFFRDRRPDAYGVLCE